MMKADESKIRREGFPINRFDARHLLDFIELLDKNHSKIEPEIIVKLEVLSGKLRLEEAQKK